MTDIPDSEVIASMKLRKPITVHGKEIAENVDELKFKLPSGRLAMRLGDPTTTVFHYSPDGGKTMEAKVLPPLAAEYLAEMTGINSGLLGQLHPLDVLDAFDKVAMIMRPTEG